MEKIKLNIMSNLVVIKIPLALVFQKAEKQLKNLVVKNFKLLKTLSFFKIEHQTYNSHELLNLAIIVESLVDLKSIEKRVEKTNIKEKILECTFHYGNLRSGEKIISDTNVVLMGNLNPGSYIKSKKSIFVYGKVRGMLHAGVEINKYQSSFIYIEESESSKIRIGDSNFICDSCKENTNLFFVKKSGEITYKKIEKSEIQRILKKISSN